MTVNGDIGVSSNFEWKPDYDGLLETVATTDYVEAIVDWDKLRNIIKYKLDIVVTDYLENSNAPPSDIPSSSPESSVTQSPNPTASGGLRLPPFPKRDQGEIARSEHSAHGRQKVYLTREEAKEKLDAIFIQMHDFEGFPPFTIQRLCELVTSARILYKNVGKFLRAVERSLLVTSTTDAFPPVPADDTLSEVASISMLSATGSLREATMPLFSPIPFLHEDARRSRSRSPPSSLPDLATRRILSPHATAMLSGADPIVLGSEAPLIGLVDEMDDPGPGHLSDYPTALSSTTTTDAKLLYGSLGERFVKSNAGAGGGQSADVDLAGAQSEGGSDDMMLDESDADKENQL